MDEKEAVRQLRDCLHGLEPREGLKTPVARWREVEVRWKYPELLRLAFRLVGVPWEWLGADEPVCWISCATYAGIPIAIEDTRQRGYLVVVADQMDATTERKLHERLVMAMRIATDHVRTLAGSQVEAGDFYAYSWFWGHDNRYRECRELAQQAYALAKERSVDFVEPRFEGDRQARKTVGAFFERLGELMILLLQAKPDFDPGGGRARRLLKADWRDRFKEVFDLEVDLAARQLFERLDVLHRAGFPKRAEREWFFLEGLARFPVALHEPDWDDVVDRAPDSFEEVCQIFDGLETFICTHPIVGLGMVAVDHHVPLDFRAKWLTRYRLAIQKARTAGDPRLLADWVEAYNRDDGTANP